MNRLAACTAYILAILGFAASAQAQVMNASLAAEVDAAIQQSLAADGTPSASVAIVRDDRIVYAKAFGDATLLPQVPATPATRYQLASLSKIYTAQAVLLLAADGKLSLDDTVSRWYPTLTNAAHITVRQLLNHTSGYPDHYPQSYPAGPRSSAALPDSIITEWGRHPLLFPPGTQYRYSNLEYEIAGRIVEKVSGQPLFEYMQAHIFRPLGMTSVLNLDTIPDGSTALATGYIQTALAPLRPAPYEGPGWSFGSGQIVTTAQDVARWDVAFLQHRILPPPEAEEEITRGKLVGGGTGPAALGLFVSHENGLTHYYHTGEGLGFTAIDLIYPDARTAFVVLTNSNVKPTYITIANRLAYLLLPPTQQDTLARKAFAGLQSGHLDLSTCSDDLKKYVTAQVLSDYQSSLGKLGPVVSFSLDKQTTTDGLETRDYLVGIAGRVLKLHLLLLPDGKLEEVTVTPAKSDN